MKEISLFSSAVESTTPTDSVPIRTVLDSIRDGGYKELIGRVRTSKQHGEKAYREAKKFLPAVTFSAKFEGNRGAKLPFSPTGIVLADIDHLNGKKEETRNKLRQDPYVGFCFESPSEDGLKVGFYFRGDIPTDEVYKRCWKKIESYILGKYGIEIDPSGKDISRLCFVSYDPNLFMNRSVTPLEIPPEPKKEKKPIPVIEIPMDAGDIEEEAHKALKLACREITQSQPTQQHHIRLKMSRLVGGYVGGGLLSRDIASAAIEEAVRWSGAKNIQAAMKTVEDGLDYGISAPITSEEIKRKKSEYVINSRGATKVQPKCNFSATEVQLSQLSEGEENLINSRGATNATFATFATEAEKEENEGKVDENTGEKSSAINRNAQAHTRARLPLDSSNKDRDIGHNPNIPTEYISAHNILNVNRSFLTSCFFSRFNLSELAGINDLSDAIRKDADLTPKEKANAEDLIRFVGQECIESGEACYLTKGGLIEFVEETDGYFTNREVYDAFGAISKESKKKIRSYLSKLVKEEIVDRHKTINGKYRKINKESDIIDFLSASDDAVNLWLPFGLHKMVKILPGNIILIAGSPNAGKTALILNMVRYNFAHWNIHYFNSEMGADELRMRLQKFPDMTLEDWGKAYESGKFVPKERSHNFQDAIVPGAGNINVIDYLEMHDNFWEIGGIIRDIHDKLKGALAIIAIQKDYGRDMGRGGMATMEKPRLVIAVESGWAKIVKAKTYIGEENPNGMICKFKLVDGTRVITDKDWHWKEG